MAITRSRKALASLILISICGGVLLFASLLVRYAITGDNNLDLLTNFIQPCEPFEIRAGEKMAIVRIDDIQAHAWEGIAYRMMDEALQRKIPLLLGVIPKNLEDSQGMYAYLRNHRCNFEIAQHGWDHNDETGGESPEFRGMSKDDAYRDISRGKDILERLARERMTTFIPPNNEASKGALEAIEELNIPIVSSEGETRFDYGAATFDYDVDSIVSVERVLADCDERFLASDVCVIMLHPQDFLSDGAIDEKKYAIYPQLLDELQKRNIPIVRIKDLVEFDRAYHPWKNFLPFVLKVE